MANPLDFGKTVQGAQQLASIAKIIAGMKKFQAANTQGLTNSGPSGTNRGGSPGAVGAPVSTLASLPQSPELQALVAQGVIKEGMPPEQALAILAISKQAGKVPVDIAALKAMVEGNYQKYTGDIGTAGADWMKQIMGQNMPSDPAMAALYAQDPMFTGYAGSLAQMDETADTNLATDLAWFDKQQSAMTDYYNSMMLGAQTGTLLPAVAGGGGGGGGGGGRGFGGGGGGGSGNGDLGFGDTRTQLKDESVVADTRTDTFYENFPNFYTDMLANISDPFIRDRVESLLNVSNTPEEFLAAAEEELQSIDTEGQQYADTVASNTQFETLAGGKFEDKLQRFEELTGNVLGDDPRTRGIEQWYLPQGVDPKLPQNDAEEQEIRALEEILSPALEAATPEGMGSPAGVSRIVKTLSYIRDLARKHIADNPQSDVAANVEAATNDVTDNPNEVAVINAGHNPDLVLKPPTGPNQIGEVDVANSIGGPGGPLSESDRMFAPRYDVLSSALPGQMPRPAQTNIAPETHRGPPSDFTTPAQGALPFEEQLYQLQTAVANGENGSYIIGEMASDYGWDRDQLGRAQDAVLDIEQGGRPQHGPPSLQQLQQIMGQTGTPPLTPRELAESGGMGPENPATAGTSTPTSSRHGFVAPNQVILQGLARAGLIQGDSPDPDDPSNKVAQIMQLMQIANAARNPDVAAAQRQLRQDDLAGQLEEMGYSGEAARGFQVTNPNTGLVVNPANIRSEYQNRILYDEDTGNLVDGVMEYMKRESEREYNELYGDRDPEALAPRNEGQWWVQPEMTPEEYGEEQRFANALPDVMEMSKLYNPMITMAQTSAKLAQMAKESETLTGQATSWAPEAALATATGLPNNRTVEELSPTRDELDPYSPEEAQGYFDSSGGTLGNTGRVGNTNITRLMQQSAESMKREKAAAAVRAAAASRISKPTGGSWSSGLKKPQAGSGLKTAKSAKGLATLISVLKNFKK